MSEELWKEAQSCGTTILNEARFYIARLQVRGEKPKQTFKDHVSKWINSLTELCTYEEEYVKPAYIGYLICNKILGATTEAKEPSISLKQAAQTSVKGEAFSGKKSFHADEAAFLFLNKEDATSGPELITSHCFARFGLTVDEEGNKTQETNSS